MITYACFEQPLYRLIDLDQVVSEHVINPSSRFIFFLMGKVITGMKLFRYIMTII